MTARKKTAAKRQGRSKAPSAAQLDNRPRQAARRYSHRRDKMMAIARKTATPEQRKALAEALKRRARGRPGATKS